MTLKVVLRARSTLDKLRAGSPRHRLSRVNALLAEPAIEFVAEGEDGGGEASDAVDWQTALRLPALNGAGTSAKVLCDALPAIEPNRCVDESSCFGTHFDTSAQMEPLRAAIHVPAWSQPRV